MAARSSSASTPLLMGRLCSTRRLMRESDRAFGRRWSGRPGFFEIWFLVVFASDAGRAWWLRYTTFAPVETGLDGPRATLWAAAFAAGEPGLGIKTILPCPAVAPRADEGWIRIGEASLSATYAVGTVVHGGHRIAWDFIAEAAGGSAAPLPWPLEMVPAPTRVGGAAPEI